MANGGPGDDLIDLSRFPANFVFANGDEGNDIIIGNDRVDTLNGGEGNDQLRSGRGDDLLQAPPATTSSISARPSAAPTSPTAAPIGIRSSCRAITR